MSQNDTNPAEAAATEQLDLGPWSVSAEAVRQELQEAADLHDLSDEQAASIAALSDAVIHDAIQCSVTDYHWEAFDDLRRTAIARLAQELAQPGETE